MYKNALHVHFFIKKILFFFYIMDAPVSLEDFFKPLIKSESQVVNVKWNVPFEVYEAEGTNAQDEMSDRFNYVYHFLNVRYGEVICSSVGLHEEGENSKPHWHFHFIVSKPFAKRSSQAISNERAKFYLTQDDVVVSKMKECTYKFAPLDDTLPLWQTLSYPLKEKKRSIDPGHYIGLTASVVNMLENVGSEIYLARLAHHERVEKSLKRKADDLQELFDYCKTNRSDFPADSYRGMLEYLDETFIKKQLYEGIHYLPDPVNYVKNCKKVGVALGLIKYSDFF